MTVSDALYHHLYRRAGFGASAHELRLARTQGWSGTVHRLLRGLTDDDPGTLSIPPPQFLPFAQERATTAGAARSAEFLALTNWWIEMMTATETPLREKLVLLLHGQFPTAYFKVNLPSLLYQQNQLFRRLGQGSFTDLTLAVAKDPAMLIWLDTGTDLASHPNENFARELMERFTMGVGHYTEDDVKVAARCFTGWQLDYSTGQFVFNAANHDYGEKALLGRTGPLTGEQAIEIVCRTETSSRWVVSRIFSWLAYPVSPHAPVVSDLLSSYTGRRELRPLLEAIFNHPEFVSPDALNGLIKQPAEYVVGTLRALGLSPSSFPSGYLMNVLTLLGQQLFNPPTVGGWGNNEFWLSTATSLEQLNFAMTASGLADLTRIEEETGRGRLRVTAEMLGVDRWSRGTTTALTAISEQPAQLLALALVSPEYLSN